MTLHKQEIKDKKFTVILAAENGNLPNEYFADTIGHIVTKYILLDDIY